MIVILSLNSSAGLLLSRAAVGLGEGVAPASATDMVARVIDKSERSRAISFIFSGLHVGSLAGLLVAPTLIERFGWQTVRLLLSSRDLQQNSLYGLLKQYVSCACPPYCRG